MLWTDIGKYIPGMAAQIVHLHITVVKRNRVAGEGIESRLIKLSVNQLREHSAKIIAYAVENKVYCAAHFLCGCSKKFVSNGELVSHDEQLDVLCDEHWKQEVLGIPAEIRHVE
jgi:hypothetical protein